MSSPRQAMNDFVTAIQRGKPGPVREMLDRSPELVSMYHAGSFGGTGLIQAVLTDEGVMVDLLLDAGADIDQRSDWWAGSFGVLDHAGDQMAAHWCERGATLTPHAAARLGMAEELRALIDETATATAPWRRGSRSGIGCSSRISSS